LYDEDLLTLHPIPQTGRPTFVSHPQLLILYIFSYPYLEAFSSIYSLTMFNAMMTRSSLIMPLSKMGLKISSVRPLKWTILI
jgi:uncharacterized protein YjfI (DUF2170 family)